MLNLNARNIASTLATRFDSDAALFINAASITSTTQITAINNLVKDLKLNNLWDKMQSIYPFVGGTANSNKYNLKDSRDADAAFRLAFSGSWTFASTGAKPTTANVGNFARTFYVPSGNATSNSSHLTAYIRNQYTGTGCVIGGSAGSSVGSNAFQLFISTALSIATLQNQNTNALTNFGTSVAGFYHGNRSTSTAQQTYVNGRLTATTATASLSLTGSTSELTIGARNNGGLSMEHPTSSEIAFISIGQSLSAAEAEILYNIVQAFQTTLGRQVSSPITISRPIESTIPTRLFGPRELYGSSLITHFDATDYKNYSLSALTYVPIPQTGQTQINSAYDTSFIRRRYNTVSNFLFTINITEANNSWIGNSQANTNLFTGSSFDTNKGSLGNNSQFGTTGIGLFTPYSGNNNLAPNSGVTLGFYGFLNANNLNHPGFGPQRYQTTIGFNNSSFGFGYTGNSGSLNTNVVFYGKTGTTSGVHISNIKNVLPYVLKNSMWLFTITGSNYYWYMNGDLFDSGPLGAGIVAPNLFYPFTGSTASTGNYLSIDGGAQGNYNPCELFIASEYTPPEQVKLLYNYFIVKFKNKIGRYR